MTREEQNNYMSKEYDEAIRYMDNAKDNLRKAGKRSDGLYKDEKFINRCAKNNLTKVKVINPIDF